MADEATKKADSEEEEKKQWLVLGLSQVQLVYLLDRRTSNPLDESKELKQSWLAF